MDKTIYYSRGAHIRDNQPEMRTARDFSAFAKALLKDRGQRKGEVWFAAPFNHDGRRRKDNVEPRRFLALDFDYVERASYEFLLRWLKTFRAVCYATASDTPEAPHLRAVLELTRAASRAECIRLNQAIAGDLREQFGAAIKLDAAVYKGEQPVFTPLEGAATWDYRGKPLDVDATLARAPEGDPKSPDSAREREDKAAVRDEVFQLLQTLGMVRRRIGEGKFAVACPRESEHTMPSNDTSTVYYLGKFGGFDRGAFSCLHSHCQGRPQGEFLAAIGFVDAYQEMRDRHIKEVAAGTAEWPAPQPLLAETGPLPYPVEALPDVIRGAVQEVYGYVQAPLPMVATSALAVLSVAVQAYVDVRRNERLSGPVGLFTLTIADSGERKSTVDNDFIKPIRDYELRQAQEREREVREAKAALAAWHARRAGILESIKTAAKKGANTLALERELVRHDHAEPALPRVPRLIGDDATPEGLARRLNEGWRAVGILSNEAGSVLGGHGMNPESLMRTLSRHNTLWDGQVLTIDRSADGRSMIVRGARLAMSLQVQPEALLAFIEHSKGLARGMGFFARFLISHPASTQGTRIYAEPPTASPRLSAFYHAISAILEVPARMDSDGALMPAMLELSPPAKQAWIEFADDIEVRLRDDGELATVRDVASKVADNCARVAALFHVIEHGSVGDIQADAVARAAQVVRWHLNESLRFFSALALPDELARAVRLDDWIIAYCRRERVNELGKNYIRQHGPIRDGKALNAAITELTELDRVRLIRRKGRTLIVAVNPALVRHIKK